MQGLKRHIREAALRLDRAYPGWEEKIDLSTLNLNELDHCIIGQVLDLPLTMDAGSQYSKFIQFNLDEFHVEKNISLWDSPTFVNSEGWSFWVQEINDRRSARESVKENVKRGEEMVVTNEDFQAGVERAAMLADEATPGWEYMIDLDNLHMSRVESCVVGQITDCHVLDYYEGIREVFGQKEDHILLQSDHSSGRPSIMLATVLTGRNDFWKEEILKRREGGYVPESEEALAVA